ncbi:hypothetical protein TIFTF001_006646 [Ficus carica]|uniref:Uncharacterized protein n=1 Tax=Ficus carica TaxID=3494 RepID=A0AA88A4K8_FICCA|nr:hypothetical protein TIFTF001_006646 [Ficus carica]
MEATEDQGGGLLHQILPPRLEDAGLEDCALPPDSIKEAFLKAATAVKSRAASILSFDEDDGDCVKDPWPDAKDSSDVVVGFLPENQPPGPCASEKGAGATEIGGDDVVVGGGGEEMEDKVVVGSEEEKGGKDCVEGLQGLEIGDEKNGGGDEEEDKDEADEERPILVGGYV